MTLKPTNGGQLAAFATGAALALLLGPTIAGDPPRPVLIVLAVLLLLVAATASWIGLRTARRRVARRQQALKRMNTARRVATHEINGALAVTMGHVELVADDPSLSEEHRETLRIGLRNARRTLELIESLVAGTRPTTVAETGTDLAAVAREAVEDIAHLAARRHVTISLDATETAHVHGDRSQLRQVIDNLLHNAVKYTDDTDGWVDVLVAPLEERVLLQVTNGGTTLTPEEATQALEPEFRGAATASSNVPGSGIGLAVVKDIVTQYSGEVELVSDVEAGATTARVELPLVQPAQSA